jgi:hypothetical protein
MAGMRNAFCLENLKGREHSEYSDINWKVILERILGKWYGKVWKECIWLRITDQQCALVNTVMNLQVP